MRVDRSKPKINVAERPWEPRQGVSRLGASKIAVRALDAPKAVLGRSMQFLMLTERPGCRLRRYRCLWLPALAATVPQRDGHLTRQRATINPAIAGREM